MPSRMSGKRCPAGHTRWQDTTTCLKKCRDGYSRKKHSVECTKKKPAARKSRRKSKTKRAVRFAVPHIHELD